MCSGDICLGLLAILFPPIAVWIKSGICTADSLINILLCTLGYLPGLLHAWYIISLYPEPDDYEYQTIPSDQGENGRVTHYYVNHQPSNEALRQQNQPHGGQHMYVPGPQQQRGYGTVPQQEGQQAGGESAQGGVPPSYEQAIQGDNKLQK
ncbi:hypothetical protein HO133_007222 [Letharia lupina]|uniref:Stress response RCI peptide n=1 Tax=Letharia lupina TaxID=560253 RepID=A0A8H6KYE0_9LECA|nr:uncharacterized protein HO133_007222 [Letharia lupina]KAF6229108.1 hypothetical protein HO133_007222 [Letharia lupina]